MHYEICKVSLDKRLTFGYFLSFDWLLPHVTQFSVLAAENVVIGLKSHERLGVRSDPKTKSFRDRYVRPRSGQITAGAHSVKNSTTIIASSIPSFNCHDGVGGGRPACYDGVGGGR